MDIIQTTATDILTNLAIGVITLLGVFLLSFVQKATSKMRQRGIYSSLLLKT